MSSHLDFLNCIYYDINLKNNLREEFQADKKREIFSLQQLCIFSLYNNNNENKETLKHVNKLALNALREYIKIYEFTYEASYGEEPDLYTPYLEEITSQYIELNEIDTALQLINELINKNKSSIIICPLLNKLIESLIKNKKFDEAKKLLKINKENLMRMGVVSSALLEQFKALIELNKILKVFDENEVEQINQKITYLMRVTNPAYLYF